MSSDGKLAGLRRDFDLATFEVRPAVTSVVVQVIGEIDLSNAARLVAKLQDVIGGAGGGRRAPRVVLDLSELRFLDARGLAALVESQRFADSAGTRLELANPPPMLRKLLRITELDGTLTVAED